MASNQFQHDDSRRRSNSSRLAGWQPDAKDARHDDGGGTIKQRTVLCWASS
jgi:hypothetical protein